MIKVNFYQVFLSLVSHPSPYDINIFQENVQLIFSLFNQILGLDSGNFLSEVMSRFLVHLSQFVSVSKCLNFVEFLDDKIHSQLVSIHMFNHFRFQTYLVNIFYYCNQPKLKQLEPKVFSDKSIILAEMRGITTFHFISRLMSMFYKFIFNTKLPNVSKEMKSKLQLSPKTRTGDWFLYKHHTVIRAYGFYEAPYLMPSFLTPRLFALEFIRKKLYYEIEHFLNHTKVSNLKFSFNVGPFIVKTKSALQVV